MATSFTDPLGISLYQAIACKSALQTYAKFKLQMNSSWTPRAMMRLASSLTGQTFKARDYKGAALALEAWIKEAQVEAIKQGAIK